MVVMVPRQEGEKKGLGVLVATGDKPTGTCNHSNTSV